MPSFFALKFRLSAIFLPPDLSHFTPIRGRLMFPPTSPFLASRVGHRPHGSHGRSRPVLGAICGRGIAHFSEDDLRFCELCRALPEKPGLSVPR